ncbi:MAG: DUF7178 family protein, partial [Candidatus Binatia bacterium]
MLDRREGNVPASQAKSRPYWIKDGGDVSRLRNRLGKLASEGEPYKRWYEESAQKIMDLYKGDPKQAETLAKLIATFSPRTPVGGDLGHAMAAIQQFRNDQPIKAGLYPAKMSEKALQVLTGKEDEATVTGIKRNTFYRNLMLYIDPKNHNIEDAGATVDMWIAHTFGFDHDLKGRITQGEYRYAEGELGTLAQKLGWSIDQTQAAVWVSTKARFNATRAEARDWGIRNKMFDSIQKEEQMQFNFNEPGGGPPIKLKDDPAVQRKFLAHWREIALAAKIDEATLQKAG